MDNRIQFQQHLNRFQQSGVSTTQILQIVGALYLVLAVALAFI